MIADSSSVASKAASVRRPPNSAVRRVKSGHVLKQRIAAHSAAEMKGRRINRQATARITTAVMPVQCSIVPPLCSLSFNGVLISIQFCHVGRVVPKLRDPDSSIVNYTALARAARLGPTHHLFSNTRSRRCSQLQLHRSLLDVL